MAKARKKKSGKAYSGFMTFPIYGADTQEAFKLACGFYGDFADPRKRAQIFKRPRKYRVEIHFRLPDLSGWDITELYLPKVGVDRHELSQIMFDYAVKDLKEIMATDNVDLEKSFFKVML